MGTADLPAAMQLALNYAPAQVRPLYATFFELDTLCERTVVSAAKPMFAQIRLAWWREVLGKDVDTDAGRTPLVLEAHLAWNSPATALIALVDGWEHMVEDSFTKEIVTAFCCGREAVAVELAKRAGHAAAADAARIAARRWSLAGLLLGTKDYSGRAYIGREANTLPRTTARLPLPLRPFAVLDALSRVALAKGGARLVEGRTSAAVALRAGLLGR